MWQKVLVLVLALMAGINLLFDFLRHSSISDLHPNSILSLLAVCLATALPSGLALFVASKTRFKIFGIKIYSFSANLVLWLSLIAWSYLLFVRERPDFYQGASHLYVATWPIVFGFLAIFLYLVCLLIQLSYWAYQKHNKALKQGLILPR